MMRTVIDNYLELFSLITVNCHVRPENIIDNLSMMMMMMMLELSRTRLLEVAEGNLESLTRRLETLLVLRSQVEELSEVASLLSSLQPLLEEVAREEAQRTVAL